MSRFAHVFATILAIACHEASAAEFHVSTAGNDANPGTQVQPFATLQRARDEVRKLKQTGPLTQPVTIFVGGGTYRVGTSLILGAQDSGTQAAPIVWQVAAGAEVRLCGGVVLSPDAFQPVRDENTLSRLDPAAHSQVMQTDLHEIGAEDLGSYPDSFRGAPAVPELFFNDQRMTPARWPNEGWATIAKIVESGSVPREGDTSSQPGTFEYSGDQPARWNVEAGVWLLGYWCFDWYEETIKVKAIDIEKRQITLAQPTLYGIAQGNPAPRRYRALNLFEELDQPGEFYLESASGRLYCWPPTGLNGARIILSTLNSPLVSLQDASHVTLRGFVLEASLGDGIEVSGGSSNRIEACEVRNTRQVGIRVTGGVGHSVEGCNIHDTGTGGLVLEGGDRKTLAPASHQAVNNHIWRFSQHQLSYACGITLSGVGNRAAHNLLHDAPHMAVGISGNDHVFEYNIVRDVCTASDDAAALYKGRNPSCRGNVIRWQEVDITQPPYTTRYPDLVGFMNPQPGQVRVNHAKNNVLVRCEQASSGNWKFAPDEIWATDGDPGFVSAAEGNFLLRPDAEVFQRFPGFQPIPFDQVGPQPRAADISR